jgi:preprotein translocase subunit SecA
MMNTLAEETVNNYLLDDENKEEWNLVGLKDHFMGWVLRDEDLDYEEKDLDDISKADITKLISDRMQEIYSAKEAEFGENITRELERVILLKVVDTKWMNHIDDMDELKKGIGLRAFGQKNPVVEYRYEGTDMFNAMIEAIREDTVRMLLTVRIQKNVVPQREQVAKPDAPNAGSIRMTKKRPGDNDPCPCGSGKKYKKCCGMNEQ